MRKRTRNRHSHPTLSGLWITALLCGLFLTGGLIEYPAQAIGKLEEVITRLQTRYEGIEDLQADFTQVTQFKGFTQTLTSRGRFFLKKGKLRWDYLEPSQQQIFVEGDNVLFYVPEHRQVIKTHLGVELDSQVPVRLLAGSGHLDRDFNIRWRDEAKQQGPDGAYLLTLISKTPTPDFAEIQIEVAPKDFLIRKISLQEPGGNGSTFEFSQIKINHGLKDRLFTFAIPEGVVVVEQP